MNAWTLRVVKMLIVPACVAVTGLALGLALHGLAGWLDSAALLRWAALVFQTALAATVVLSGLGYRRLLERRVRPAWAGSGPLPVVPAPA